MTPEEVIAYWRRYGEFPPRDLNPQINFNNRNNMQTDQATNEQSDRVLQDPNPHNHNVSQLNRPATPDEAFAARARSISIHPQDVGYVVEVGCKRFAIRDKNELLIHLAAYMENPNKVEREYTNGTYKI